MDDLLNPLPDRASPRHDFMSEDVQFRLKIQRFSHVPAEFTVQKIDFSSDVKRYMNAYHDGRQSCFSSRTRSRPDPGLSRSEESIERSQRRAKSNIRRAVLELAPNHFSTFTTREPGPDYLTASDWSSIWSHFVRLTRSAAIDFEYVAVLERHPKNPEHFHLHVAWRGRANYNYLRRFWHMAIEAHHGRRVSKVLRGAESPGNIQDQPVKASAGSFKQARKIAKYISKYVTKDLISEFNKKRYWPSKGINVDTAQVFWLDGVTQADAIREACQMLGQWDSDGNVPAQKFFMPSDRVCWFAIDPDRTPSPPF
uniref:Replication-associated protein ORF2/G2P domain-containing protein n=1 Tax=uncultured prokaryote TaxID=198431 RepID=A0A0H5Q588_9ZZZZ|nr:hypothetical protein [uncultured prokaryote]